MRRTVISIVIAALMMPLAVRAADGDTLHVVSDNGYDVVYQVLSETAKTVSVGAVSEGNNRWLAAVPASYGNHVHDTIVIPAVVRGYKVTTVAKSAFGECRIDGLVLPEGITDIKEFAFYEATIYKMNLPKSVTHIEFEAFYRAKTYSLDSLDLPNVTHLDDGAFSDYHQLKYISIPQVDTLRSRTFFECWNLETVKFGTNLKYVSYQAFKGCKLLKALELPASVTGYETSAFEGCGIESFTVPASITELPEGLFKECTQLKEVTLPPRLKAIGEGTFRDCSSLTAIDIPQTVTAIGDGAFLRCSSLKSANLPAAIDNISEGLFYGCASLTTIDIPAGVTRIGREAFAGCSSLSRVSLPASLKTLGNRAFADCTSLEAIDLPPGIDALNSAFAGSGLRSFRVPDNIKELNNDLNGCQQLTTIDLNNVETLVFSAIAGCASLKTLHIGPKLKEFRNNDFSVAGTNLETITVDSRNETYDARGTCNALIETKTNRLVLGSQRTVVPDGVTSIDSRAFYGVGIRQLDIPNSVTSLNLVNCPELKTLNIGTGVQNFVPSSDAYSYDSPGIRNCPKLEVIKVADGNPFMDSRGNCNAIIDSRDNVLVNGCKGTVIPKNVNSIYTMAFVGSGIQEIVIPQNVETIGWNAFENCQQLETVRMEPGVKHIKSEAFKDCGRLKTVELSETLESIDGRSFENCDSIVSLSLPASLKRIDSYAFKCRELRTVYSHIREPFDINYAFHAYYLSNRYTLYIPKGTREAYLAKGWWREFNEILVDMDSEGELAEGESFKAQTIEGVEVTYTVTDAADKVVVVGGNNRKATGDLEDLPQTFKYVITIPEEVNGYRVSGIADHAFQECHYIKYINLPEGLDSIGAEAFANCVYLDELKLPSTLTKLGRRAFYFCERISGAIIIPDGVKDIPEECFAECHIMWSAYLPHGLETIGRRAFFQILGGPFFFPATLKSIGEEAILGIMSGFAELTYRSASRTPIAIPESAILWFTTPEDLEEFWIKEQSQGLLVPEGCAEIYRNTPGWSKFWPLIFEAKDVDKCNVTYRLNGEEYAHDQALYGRPYTPTVEAPTAPDGYEFSGWQVHGYAWGGTVTSDIVVVGSFVPTINKQVVRTLPVVDGSGLQCGTMDVNFLLTCKEGKYSAIVYKPRGENIPHSVMEDDGIPAFDNVTGQPGTLCLPDSITDELGFVYGVDSIGRAAFYGCDALKNIDFGSSVKAVGNMAFQRSALEGTLDIPETLTHLYHQVFGNTKKVSTVVFRHSDAAAIVWDKHGNKEDFAGPDATRIEVCQGIADECAKGTRSDNFALWYRENAASVGNSYKDLEPHQLLINDTKVTLRNASNILDFGTISYDFYTQTLTLKGCYITSLSTTLIGGLNIRVEGKNTIATLNSYKSDVSVTTNGQEATSELTVNELWATSTDEDCRNVLTINKCKTRIGTLRGFTDLQLVGMELPKKVFFRASQGLDDENLPQQNLFESFGATAAFKHDVLIDFEKPLELPFVTDPGKDFEVSFLSKFGYNAQLDDVNGEIVDGIYFHLRGENADMFKYGQLYLGTLMTDEQMERIAADGDLESTVFSEFSGMVMRVGAGDGIVTLGAATKQGAVMNIKVGTQQPVKLGSVVAKNYEVPYHTDVPCYVYIYMTNQSDGGMTARKKGEVIVEDVDIPSYPDETKGVIKSLKVHVDEASAIVAPTTGATDTDAPCYDLSGRRVDPVQGGKGIFIINGKKVKK